VRPDEGGDTAFARLDASGLAVHGSALAGSAGGSRHGERGIDA
jgi:hypothetical protein